MRAIPPSREINLDADEWDSDELIEELGKAVGQVKIEKAAIGWGLQELEDLVREVQNGEREPDSDDE